VKFIDGQWLIKKGLNVHTPFAVHDLEVDATSVTAYAPCRPVNDRGATLGGPLLKLCFFAPLPEVIGVRISHFEGGLSLTPQFKLGQKKDFTPDITDGPDQVVLQSGNLSMHLQKKSGWKIDFCHLEQRITGSGFQNAGYIQAENGDTYLREQLDLAVGECVYGLGERFTAFVKNGQVVEMWNRDGGTNTDQAYKNIPFYLTNRGYGVFVNHPERVSFEVASETVSKVQFSVAGEVLEYYIINGPTPKAVLEHYTALTGRPALPPAWSFGLWLSTSFTTSYDEATVNHFIEGMKQRDLPVQVFHFDCFWMKEYHWCDFCWDRRVFSDPEAMLARLKAKGLKICVWINPYIAQRSALFTEGKVKGYLLKRVNGAVWQWDLWQPGMGLVDFTNPEACRWYAQKLQKLIDMGVDCFKTDFGERIPTDVVYFDGSDPDKMHNYYTYLYNKTVFELMEANFGRDRALVFARSATVGSQSFPVHWGGDCWASYPSMADSLRGGLSLGLCGFGFWSHDIGGFEQTATADLYKRWVAFGLLSSHSRLHGSSSYRVPWQFDEEAVTVLRYFTKLKCRLMPYLFAMAHQAAAQGIPMMRPMILEFPDDPTCAYLDRQYMLGDSLLVAPIFSESGVVSYYVPAGEWFHIISGARITGAGWRQEKHDYLSLPLLVPVNTLVAVGAVDDRAEYDYATGVCLHLFGLEEGHSATVTVFAPEGTMAELTVTVHRIQGRLLVQKHGVVKPWTLLLRGLCQLQAVHGGTANTDPSGILITPNCDYNEIEVEL
jgi:alpha-D-xyloside xylohydrolase